MIRRALIICLCLAASQGAAQTVEPREGWQVTPTAHGFDTLVERVRAAIEAAPIMLVSEASASAFAARQGFEIPGNRVFDVFRNDYARRMLGASVAAGIEAPMRLYVTEDPDGSGRLSYIRPSAAFAPYAQEGGPALERLGTELDEVFAGIAAEAEGG